MSGKTISTSRLWKGRTTLYLDQGQVIGASRSKQIMHLVLYQVPTTLDNRGNPIVIRVKNFQIKIQVVLEELLSDGVIMNPIPRFSCIAHLQRANVKIPSSIRSIYSRSIIGRKTFLFPDIRTRQVQSIIQTRQSITPTSVTPSNIRKRPREEEQEPDIITKQFITSIALGQVQISQLYTMHHKLHSRASRLARWDNIRKTKIGGRRWFKNYRRRTNRSTQGDKGSTVVGFSTPGTVVTDSPTTSTSKTSQSSSPLSRLRYMRNREQLRIRRIRAAKRRQSKGANYVILSPGDHVDLYVQIDNYTDSNSFSKSVGTLDVVFNILVNLQMTTVQFHNDTDREQGLEEEEEQFSRVWTLESQEL